MSQTLTVELFEKSIKGLEDRLIQKVDVIVENKIVHAIEELALSTGKGFAEVHEKFDKINEKFVKIDEKFEKIDTRLNTIDYKLEKIEFNTTDHNHRLSALEDKMKIVTNKLGLQI
jgi:hypothetical protein